MASSSPTSGGDHPLGQLELGVFVRGEEEAAAVEAVDAVQQHAAVERRRELTCDAPLEDSGSSFSELEANVELCPRALPAAPCRRRTSARPRRSAAVRPAAFVCTDPSPASLRVALPATAESGCAL